MDPGEGGGRADRRGFGGLLPERPRGRVRAAELRVPHRPGPGRPVLRSGLGPREHRPAGDDAVHETAGHAAPLRRRVPGIEPGHSRRRHRRRGGLERHHRLQRRGGGRRGHRHRLPARGPRGQHVDRPGVPPPRPRLRRRRRRPDGRGRARVARGRHHRRRGQRRQGRHRGVLEGLPHGGARSGR